MEANQELNDLFQNSNGVICFLKRMKKEVKDLKGKRRLRGRGARLRFTGKDREKFGRNT